MKVLALIAVLFLSPICFVTAAQTTRPIEQIALWFGQLSDRNPEVREQAKTHLMGLRRSELDLLRAVVVESQPIVPSQDAALRDIVIHVYLAGQPYPKQHGGAGFLGVMLESYIAPAHADGGGGVLIVERVPGFCGFRHLQPGDLVLGIVTPEQIVPVLLDSDLRNTVRATRAGNPITLSLLRQGKMMRVTFMLDATPDLPALHRAIVQEFVNERLEKAEQYWRSTFGPLAGDGIS